MVYYYLFDVFSIFQGDFVNGQNNSKYSDWVPFIFSRVFPVVDQEFHQNIVKVAMDR